VAVRTFARRFPTSPFPLLPSPIMLRP
jgi:hypothetical protein